MDMWEGFLTVYLLVLLVISTMKIPEREKVLANMQGAIIGGILKYITIFICLYYGGFYN